jgi:hypothetical protein
MEMVVQRRCLECCFPIAESDTNCPKCDSPLAGQTDGSTVTIDIAHNKQRIHQAIEQLRSSIELHHQSTTQFLRVIVGGDRIRKAAIAELQQLQLRGLIVQFGQDDKNSGAMIVLLKRSGQTQRSR